LRQVPGIGDGRKTQSKRVKDRPGTMNVTYKEVCKKVKGLPCQTHPGNEKSGREKREERVYIDLRAVSEKFKARVKRRRGATGGNQQNKKFREEGRNQHHRREQTGIRASRGISNMGPVV